MGEVLLAEHLGLGKLVAVKLMNQEFAADPSFQKRMQIEARSLAALAHPHIVQVTDLGQTVTGRTYIVMERLVGCTLGAEVKARGALPVGEAVGYVLQVLAGLQAAHDIGLVHRDIKLENIFLCEGSKSAPRTVKILDFGVVKVLDVATDIDRPALPHLVTEEGGIVGTPRLLAPEQALGKTVDARTDVYATGLLLYTLLTGRNPFADIRDDLDLLTAIVQERPPPPSTRTEQPIPPELDAAVLRALEKKPADRFPTADAFANALRAYAIGSAEIATTAHLTPDPLHVLPPAGSGAEGVSPRGLRGQGPGDEHTLLLRAQPAAERGADGAAASAAAYAPDDVDDCKRTRPYVPRANLAGRDPRKPRFEALTAPLRTGSRRRNRIAFLALTLLGAVVSAVLLVVLSHAGP